MCFSVDLSQLQDFMLTLVKHAHVYSILIFTKIKSIRKGGQAPRVPRAPPLATPLNGNNKIVYINGVYNREISNDELSYLFFLSSEL